MSKVVAGFLLGVIVTLAIVFLVDNTPSETESGGASGSSQHEEQDDAQRTVTTGRVAEVVDDDEEDSLPSVPIEAVTDEVPHELQAQSTAGPQQRREPGGARQVSSTSPAATQYPPEIEEMIEKRVDKELQARYENDEREESWAAYMEGQLAAYFAQKTSLAQFYFSLIDCRTSVCSVHAIGYGTDALTQWNTATADLVSQHWMEFNSMSMNRRNPEPDVLAIVLILTKKPAD